MVTTTEAADDADAAELWPVYDAVFGDFLDIGSWRQAVWDRHAARDGFRLVRAYDTGRLVGFAYGYTGEHGQWWTDHVARVLDPEVADSWLGGHFELVSLGVLPAARGRGLGRALLDAIAARATHGRWLLMTTSDADDPARRLYATAGWSVIGPGLHPDQVVMGRRGLV